MIAKRLFTTVLGITALVVSVRVVSAATTSTPQLMITSATFDEANNRLVISGQNFTAREHHSTPPHVTLDLMPLTVLSASPTEIVAVLSGTFPDGTYRITVWRGNGANES